MKSSWVLVSEILLGVLVVTSLSKLLDLKRASKQEKDPLPYKMKNLMSPTELKLFSRLVAAYPQHFIMSQVQLSQIITVPKGSDNYMGWLNKISRMSLDFVICDYESKPLCVIELDGASHLAKSSKDRDAKKDRSLAAASIRIVRIKVSEIPTVSELTKLINI
jgi:hypothetical protein